MTSVLLTGFEPFGGELLNPSELAVRALDGCVIGGHRVAGRTLPCVFGEAREVLATYLAETRPVVVIAVGQAGGRAELCVERVAINVDDARIPDNRGRQPIDAPIVAAGPAAYWSTLPLKAIVAAWRAEGIAGAVSQTAGTFVCNHVFYGLMHALAGGAGGQGPVPRAGFIHVPFVPEQVRGDHASRPAVPLATIVRALACAVEVTLATTTDRAESGGATH